MNSESYHKTKENYKDRTKQNNLSTIIHIYMCAGHNFYMPFNPFLSISHRRY